MEEVVVWDITQVSFPGTPDNAPVKFAVINAAGAGDNTVIAAVPEKKLRILSYVLNAAAAVTATWKSSGGTAISGPMSLAIAGTVATDSLFGVMETISGEGLILTLGAALQTGGHVAYAEIAP